MRKPIDVVTDASYARKRLELKRLFKNKRIGAGVLTYSKKGWTNYHSNALGGRARGAAQDVVSGDGVRLMGGHMVQYLNGIDPRNDLHRKNSQGDVVQLTFLPKGGEVPQSKTVTKEVKSGFFGRTKTVDENVPLPPRPVMLSDVLRTVGGEDGEAHLVGYTVGRIPNQRPGSALHGVLAIPKGVITEADIRRDPELVHMTLKHIFPDIFKDIRHGKEGRSVPKGKFLKDGKLEYDKAPHHIVKHGSDLSGL